MVARRPGQPVSAAFDIDRAGTQIAEAFDPTVARPAIVDRVLDGVLDNVGSVDADPIAPVELKPDLDLPAWRFLRDDDPDWLLPGAGTILEDSVVALTTNPGFVDAFMVGLNAEVVAELRFRNHPLIPGWTPVRTFWDRVNLATGAVDDDIVDIGTWPADSPFGSPSHQTPSASSADLVVLFAHPALPRVPRVPWSTWCPPVATPTARSNWTDRSRLRRSPVPHVPGSHLTGPRLLRVRPRSPPRRGAVGRAGRDRDRPPLLQRRKPNRARRPTAPISPPRP